MEKGGMKGDRPSINILYQGGRGEEEKRNVGTQQREEEKKKILRMCDITKVCIYIKS